MQWASIIAPILKLIVWLIKNKLDDQERKVLAQNAVMQEALNELTKSVAIAKEIDADSRNWSTDDINRILYGDGQHEPTVGNNHGNVNSANNNGGGK
jgi:hypothetical protein